MADIVRTTGCTFGEAVKRSAEWEHDFSFYSPQQVGAQRGGQVLPDADEDLRKKTSATHKKDVAEYRRVQSERDKALHKLETQQGNKTGLNLLAKDDVSKRETGGGGSEKRPLKRRRGRS